MPPKILLSLLLLVSVSSVWAGVEPVQHWYEFRFHKKKVGFLQMSDKEVLSNGQKQHHAYRRSVVMVRRQAHNIRIEAVTDAWSDPEGVPQKFIHRRTENEAERLITGEKKGSQFIVDFKAGDRRSSKTIPLTPQTYLSSSLDHIFKRRLAPGKSWQGKVIVEEDGELRDFSIKVIKKNTDGSFEVESVVAGIMSKESIDAKGVTLKTVVSRLGAEFVKTDRQNALQFEETQDIFSAARLNSGAILPPGKRLRSLRLRLQGRSDAKPNVLKDSRQFIRRKKKNSVEVDIKISTLPTRPAKLPIRTKRLAKYLVATPYEALDDQKLVAQAQALKGQQRNAWIVAKKINAFVHGHITNKSLAHAFATASEALQAKEGDCTEHAVLFSALAKIVGLPTKLITGLVYVGGPDGIFGYHQWVEVWLGERWVAMDPTFGQHIADPTHIKFTEGLSDAEGLREAGVAAAELFGDMKLKVLEYRTLDGKRKRL